MKEIVFVEVSGPKKERERVVRILKRFMNADLSKQIPKNVFVALIQKGGK